jgi:hypothetical protein
MHEAIIPPHVLGLVLSLKAIILYVPTHMWPTHAHFKVIICMNAIQHADIRKVGRKITGLTDDVIGGYYMFG